MFSAQFKTKFLNDRISASVQSLEHWWKWVSIIASLAHGLVVVVKPSAAQIISLNFYPWGQT